MPLSYNTLDTPVLDGGDGTFLPVAAGKGIGGLQRSMTQGGLDSTGRHTEAHRGADGAGAADASPNWHSCPQKDSANSSPPHPSLTITHRSAHKEQGLLPALKAPGLPGMANTDCSSSDLWVGSTSRAVGSTAVGYAGAAPRVQVNT